MKRHLVRGNSYKGKCLFGAHGFRDLVHHQHSRKHVSMQAETELRKDWQASGRERDWTWLEHLKPQSFSAPCATLPPTRLFLLNPCQDVAFPNSQASRYTSLWGHPYSNHHSVHCFSGLRSKMKVTVSRALRFPTLCFYSSVCFVVVVSTIIYSDPGFPSFIFSQIFLHLPTQPTPHLRSLSP